MKRSESLEERLQKIGKMEKTADRVERKDVTPNQTLVGYCLFYHGR